MDLFKPQYPLVALQLDDTRVAALKLSRVKSRFKLVTCAVETWPAGTFETSMIRPNIRNAEVALDTIDKVLRAVRPEDKSISVLLPDRAVKISLLPFEELPQKRAQALNLIQWKLKKTIPFKIEEAVMDYHFLPGAGGSGGGAEDGNQLLVVSAPKAVVRQVEETVEKLGYHAGLIDISTLNLFNFYHDVILGDAGPTADTMLLNVDDTWFTIGVFRGDAPRMFRTKTMGNPDVESGVRGIASEVQTSLVFYRDRLNGPGVQKCYLRGSREVYRQLDPAVRSWFPLGCEWIHPERILGRSGVPSVDQEQLQAVAPLIGLAMGR